MSHEVDLDHKVLWPRDHRIDLVDAEPMSPAKVILRSVNVQKCVFQGKRLKAAAPLRVPRNLFHLRAQTATLHMFLDHNRHREPLQKGSYAIVIQRLERMDRIE